jgi:predicted transposase/invertase (TIGR01784 family)
MNIAQQIKEKGKLEGIQQGIQQRDVSIIQHMLKMGLSENDILKYTGTSIELIRNISHG